MSLEAGSHRARWLLALGSSFWCATGNAQTANAESAGEFTERELASAFATSVVLNDTELVTLGFLSFDPGSFIPGAEDQFASEESVGRRDSVTTFALPWKWKLAPDERRLIPYVKVRLSFLETKQDIIRGTRNPDEPDARPPEQNANGATDTSRNRVYGAYLGAGLAYEFTEKWQMEAGGGLHLLRYQNDYKADASLSPITAEDVEGTLFNTSATALMGQLQTRITYSSETRDVPWKYQSTYSYYVGETINTSRGLPDVKPKTWSWANGLTAYWDLPEVLNTSNKLRVLARRVDVGGDVIRTLETDHYYQMGVGWLFDLEGDPSWLDNLGISVMVNYGSALSGGSLVLLYNEDW